MTDAIMDIEDITDETYCAQYFEIFNLPAYNNEAESHVEANIDDNSNNLKIWDRKSTKMISAYNNEAESHVEANIDDNDNNFKNMGP